MSGEEARTHALPPVGAPVTAPGPPAPRWTPALAVWVVPLIACAWLGALPVLSPEIPGHVRFHRKISQTAGGFQGALSNLDGFGRSVTSLGDVDGNGVSDLAVGAALDDDGGLDRGAVWILFLDSDGGVVGEQKISLLEGGFAGPLADEDRFGTSVAGLGDLDGDGVPDLAVGAISHDTGSTDQGAIFVLFLEADGSVAAQERIGEGVGGFTGQLDPFDSFGQGLAALGDLDGDGTTDLAVSAPGDDDGGSERGALWILFLLPDGKSRAQQKVSSTSGGFGGALANGDSFGSSVASLGDLDGDGHTDIAAGAAEDNDGGLDRGAVWILSPGPDGVVHREQKISALAGGFTGSLDDLDFLGIAVAGIGDLDCDGLPDVAAGAVGDDDGGSGRGAFWNLFLTESGTVDFPTKVSSTFGGFTGALDGSDLFAVSIAPLGDLDGDGNLELAVGAMLDDDGGDGRGAVWLLYLDGGGCAATLFRGDFESGDTAYWSVTLP
jgi:hypothetical protein